MGMKICVAGWYFRPRFLEAVRTSGYEAIVIKHREGDAIGIPSILYDNFGLEFGCYRSYVQHHWDGVSDVFFCHDDAEVSDVRAFDDIASLTNIGVGQAYIFHDEYDEYVNGGAHGRGIWIRADVLKKLQADFPADRNNNGVHIGRDAQKGIFAFHKRMKELGDDTQVIAIVPQFRFAFRGRLHESLCVYRHVGSTPKGVALIHE